LQKLLLVLALMFSIALAALDATVISTALPTIVGELGGLSLFSWAFSAYLLASTVTVPLYGKLADLYGRKPILLFGAGLFLVGSILCGAAGSMEQLVVFRAVQGLGAGAVQPITMTVIGDIFTIEERARIQGLFSSVWGVTSLAGPALGGLLAGGLSWRWVFFINVPIGLVAIFLIWRFFDEKPEKQSHVLDYWGTLLLAGAVVALLLGLLQGVESFGWTGFETLSLFGVSAVLLAIFLVQETRTPEPVLPLWLFRNKVIAVSCAAIFVSGGLMFGVQSYVPLFVQGVFGGTAFDAGLVVLPMSVSWPIASLVGGRMILRFGYYASAVTGGLFLILGAGTLIALNRDSSQAVAMTAAFIVGFGMGFLTSALIISVQNAVEWRHRGVATASTQFFRTIGGAVSVAVMGAILNTQLSSRFAEVPGVPPGATAETLLNVEQRGEIAAPVLDAMQRALASSLHDIYFYVLASALVLMAIVLFFPRGSAESLSAQTAQAAPAGRGPPRGAEPAEAEALAPPEAGS
jgi:EmrB/QacA subfamily drug resistance transporter